MRWPRRLRGLCHRRRTPDEPPVSEDQLEQMRADTERRLQQARAQDDEAHALADRHRHDRNTNHFGEMFLRLLEGGRDV